MFGGINYSAMLYTIHNVIYSDFHNIRCAINLMCKIFFETQDIETAEQLKKDLFKVKFYQKIMFVKLG